MPADADQEITQLLARYRAGDTDVEGPLMAAIESTLRRTAASAMMRESSEHTLQATALVNEAWLKIFRGENPLAQRVNDRQHLHRLAARAMRNLLVDHARRKRAGKRSADGNRIRAATSDQGDDEIFALDSLAVDFRERNRIEVAELNDTIESLQNQERLSARQVELIQLRFFLGHSVPEAAEALGISVSTVEQDWRFARATLRAELSDS